MTLGKNSLWGACKNPTATLPCPQQGRFPASIPQHLFLFSPIQLAHQIINANNFPPQTCYPHDKPPSIVLLPGPHQTPFPPCAGGLLAIPNPLWDFSHAAPRHGPARGGVT